MKKNGKVIKDCLLTIILLCAFLAISLGIEIQFDACSLIPAFFSLAVFLISFFTDGYIFGILSSLVSVLMVNFAFTFPYFKFNFRAE